jgi:three-Cys-motif partner protein
MAKDKSHFFDRKEPWSKVKDDLLACYLKPYFQKVLFSGRPVRYIDAFAGRGQFMDGEPGSPLIALGVARECVLQGTSGNTDINLAFIEAYLAAELQSVVSAAEYGKRPAIGYCVINGRFERETAPLVSGMAGCNVFLYIDPYGISDLDFRLLTSFSNTSLGLRSIELLVNLNSFGFVRAACRALRVRYEDDAALVDDDDAFSDPIEAAVEASDKPAELLNTVAGGDYWRRVIEESTNRGKIDGLVAERRFSDLYRDRLRETYKYVLSMPIRLADRKSPKYRMIHATNHPAGCVLMAENMMTRTQTLYIHIQSYAQGTLFSTDIEGEITDPTIVGDQMAAVVNRLDDYTEVEKVMADFYVSQGVICKPDIIRQAWAQMEDSGVIDVRRDPATTATGRKSKFFTTTKDKRVEIRRKTA